ncbi:MAG: VanZ family protein [Mesobacillus sp.]
MWLMFNYELLFGVDKLMHFAGFAGVSACIGLIILLVSDQRRARQHLSVVWITLVTIGIIEEYRQYFDPDRSAEFLDAIANIIGVTTGIAVSLFLSYLIKRKQKLLSKVFSLYTLVLLPLLFGLLYLNERPFFITEEPILEKIRNLGALIGF